MKEIYRKLANEVGISVEYLTNTKQIELIEKFAELVWQEGYYQGYAQGCSDSAME